MENKETNFLEKQLVIFNIGKESFGIDINDVREIIRMETLTKIPETPNYVKGILNLRDKIVVVIDLAEKLGLQASSDEQNKRIIITELEKGATGFIVDNCNEVMRLSAKDIQEAPSMITQKINSKYLQGVGTIKNKLLILIDLKAVTDLEELQLF